MNNIQGIALQNQQGGQSLKTSDSAKLHRAAVEFEAIMLQEFLKQAQSQMSKGLFGGGMAEEFFQDHLTQERARAMAENGGIGLADMLDRELQKLVHLKSSDSSTDNLSKVDAQRRGLENYGKNSQL